MRARMHETHARTRSRAWQASEKSEKLDEESAKSEVAAEEGATWAHECMRLTHDPIRQDLLAMQEALHHISDDKPAPWRVASFFRFFDSFCELCKQQFNVELTVYCDWLCAESGVAESGGDDATGANMIVAHEHRVELLRHRRDMEEQMQGIAALEEALLNAANADAIGKIKEVEGKAQRSISRMVSSMSMRKGGDGSLGRGGDKDAQKGKEQARELQKAPGMLREAFGNLVADMRAHLESQETVLPEYARTARTRTRLRPAHA